MTTRDLIRDAGGPELLERLLHLDAKSREQPPNDTTHSGLLPAIDEHATTDFDVVIAGGGLWSILAPILAALGLRVAVVERARAGVAHREWNASRRELEALVECRLVDNRLDDFIVASYRDGGTCAFHEGGSYPVANVLDHAVDAGKLLAHARALGEKRGVTYLDRSTIRQTRSTASRIAIQIEGQNGPLVANVLVDARGASSPFSTADLVCPTVGGVLTGLEQGPARDQMDPNVGQILATIDPIDVETGRQHVWEAFAGREGETTVYLFYYARRGEEPVSLLDLFARFFRTLPDYKRGVGPTMLRPTFGLIPGWSRLTPPSAPPPSSRIILVGDAAARHSPLTYCGFGATIRSLGGAANAIANVVELGAEPPTHVMRDAPIHSFTGALAHMLASRRFRGNDLNALLDAAFSSLHEMGNEPYAKLLRDEMTPVEMVSFLRRTAKKHPAVWRQVWGGIGLRRLGRWTAQVSSSFFP